MAGRRSLEEWLREPLEPVQLRHPLLLRFVFSADMPPAELDGLLSRYRGEMSQRRDEYRARLEDGWCDAEIAWIALWGSSFSGGSAMFDSVRVLPPIYVPLFGRPGEWVFAPSRENPSVRDFDGPLGSPFWRLLPKPPLGGWKNRVLARMLPSLDTFVPM